MSFSIDWDALALPEYEDPSETKVRLDAIHRQILVQKGIGTKPEKNSPGFIPSAYQARQVSVMAALGLDLKDIALVLNVEEKMVKLYYAKELRVTHNLANAMVARQALSMALSGRYPDMTKFWLKAQAGWSEAPPKNANDAGSRENLDSAKDRLKRTIQDHSRKVS